MNRLSLQGAGRGLSAVLAVTALFMGGCTEDRQIGDEGNNTGAGNELEIENAGKLTPGAGKTVPTHAVVQTIWGVSATSPDYSYISATGEASNGTFHITLAEPPAEALNLDKLGVGGLVLLPDGGALPEGKLADPGALKTQLIGMTGPYAIIYKKADVPDLPWVKDFPDGYSCARGVPSPMPGQEFDSFTPVDCSELEIIVDSYDNIETTNWT